MARNKVNSYFHVHRADQMRVLASAARQEIVDNVQMLGECTAAELAHELGRPADGLYYHLRVLVEAGLLVSTNHGSSGRGEARYAIPESHRSMRLNYDTSDPEQAAAVKAAVATLLRVANKDFAAALVPGTVTEGPARELWAGRQKAWLSEAELREANTLIERLNRLFDKPRSTKRDRLFSFSYALAPVSAAPVRRGTQKE